MRKPLLEEGKSYILIQLWFFAAQKLHMCRNMLFSCCPDGFSGQKRISDRQAKIMPGKQKLDQYNKINHGIDNIRRKENNRMKMFSKIKSFFCTHTEDRIEIVDRDEFAREMRECFGGNTELLKAIEKCMNRNVKLHQRVSLTN